MTAGGGAAGNGVAFGLEETAPGIWAETILYSFGTQKADLSGPPLGGALIQDQNGNIFGCGYYGKYNDGGIYLLSPPSSQGETWQESVVYHFGDQQNDPKYLSSCSLTLGSSGSLFGTTDAGGLNKLAGAGTFFSIKPPSAGGSIWTEQVLYNFIGGPRGHDPTGVLAHAGNIYYGVTQYSGFQSRGSGVVYAIAPQ